MYSTIHEVARATLRFADLIDPPGRRSLLDPRNFMRAGLIAARHGAESIDRIFRGGKGRAAFSELDNRIRAFRLFETVGSTLDLPSGDFEAAAVVAEAAARLGPEGAVWACEGLGYEIGRRLLVAEDRLPCLPEVDSHSALPGSWAVLHTGAGMALAESFLAAVQGGQDPGKALRDHIENCERLAQPGEASMVFEPLGLVVRLLRPGLVRTLDTELQKLEGPWLELFWHGVGRGVYFLPSDLSPLRSAPWRGWTRCSEEPPGPRGLRNARAGFAWALTLVNLETPGVMEAFLAHHGHRGDAKAITNGIASALCFWELVTGGSRSQRRFVAHVATPQNRKLWRRFVSDTVATCKLGTTESWGDLYRYRD